MISFFRKLIWFLRRPDKEAEIQEELRFHLGEEASEREAQGLTGEAAAWAAHRELGNLALVQEDTRAMWTWTSWEHLVQDIRYGLRTIAADKTFSTMAILVKPTDPLALTGSVVVLVIAAILAGYLPARNASRIDPMIAIRHE